MCYLVLLYYCHLNNKKKRDFGPIIFNEISFKIKFIKKRNSKNSNLKIYWILPLKEN